MHFNFAHTTVLLWLSHLLCLRLFIEDIRLTSVTLSTFFAVILLFSDYSTPFYVIDQFGLQIGYHAHVNLNMCRDLNGGVKFVP